MSSPILLSLGSNIDPLVNLERAVHRLGELVTIVAGSRVFRSPPVGAPGTPDFCNAALELETSLDAHALKWNVLRSVEARLGRVRTDDRNAPRPIDLDLALFGSEVIEIKNTESRRPLRVPDPDILRFVHVVRPLVDLYPDFRHPIDGRPLTEIAEALAAETPSLLVPCSQLLELDHREAQANRGRAVRLPTFQPVTVARPARSRPKPGLSWSPSRRRPHRGPRCRSLAAPSRRSG